MPSTKFNVGDRVKCVKSSSAPPSRGGIEAGAIYTVRSNDRDGDPIFDHESAKVAMGWTTRYFILHAKAGQFVAGDKIVALRDFYEGGCPDRRRLTVGKVYTACTNTSSRYAPGEGVCIEACDRGHVCNWPVGFFRLATTAEITAHELASVPKPKFSPGDKVVFWPKNNRNPSGGAAFPIIGTVESTKDGVVTLKWSNAPTLSTTCPEEKLRAYVAPVVAFKVGDRVAFNRGGVHGTISSANDGRYTVDWDNGAARNCSYRAPELCSVASAAPSVKAAKASKGFDPDTGVALAASAVAFKAGDIVECVAERGYGKDRHTTHGKKGQRYTVAGESVEGGVDLVGLGKLSANRFRKVDAYPVAGPPEGGFKVGDIVECVDDNHGGFEIKLGQRYVLNRPTADIGGAWPWIDTVTPPQGYRPTRFRLISRPNAAEWHLWAGGENPVPGMTVVVRYPDGSISKPTTANSLRWTRTELVDDIFAFRIVPAALVEESRITRPYGFDLTGIHWHHPIHTPYFQAFGRARRPVAFDFVTAATTRETVKPAKLGETKVKVGDILTVRVEVTKLDPSDSHRPVETSGGMWPNVVNIVSVEPATLKVGDKVAGPYLAEGEIVLIKGDEAVIENVGGLEVHDLSELARAS